NLAAVEEVPLADTARYGILDVAADDGNLVRARGVVEKPAPESAPSRLAIIGRYILDPAVLHALDAHRRGAGNEIQLTDAIADSMATTPFHGFRFEGRRIDCGTPLGLLEGSLAVAARDPAARDHLRAVLDRP
ncbi:MAG: UTP--glucose-1-phosphate uridylyltransferase, partial [Gammaproteobacteria bacterium]